jgi:DNA-binding NarL/FixJ family response regulator
VKMSIKTLLLIEHSVQMRRLIQMLLANKIEHIAECAEGSEALAAYANYRPDCVLMDINIKSVDANSTTAAGIKSVDAIAITRRIIQLFPDAYITILADYDDPDIREAAYRAGASGYLIKDDLSSLPELLAERLSRRDAGRAE